MFGVLVFYAAMLAINLIVLIPPRHVAQPLGHPAGWDEYLRVALMAVHLSTAAVGGCVRPRRAPVIPPPPAGASRPPSSVRAANPSRRERGPGRRRVDRDRVGYVASMTAVTPRHGARASAIDDLLGALETLVAQYRSLPETERERCWSRNAERITGEVGSHLDVARSRVRSAFIAPAPIADDRGGRN